MKKLFWILTNIYGKIFGWSFFSTFHHAVITFSLHGLGYGNMYRESWTGEEWFIKKILAPTKPSIILDVGANVGNYSRMLIKETDAKIFAFEPNPSSYSKLLELNERVIKINKAVSDYEGTAELNFKFDFDGKASLDPRVRSGKTEKVEVATLSSFIEAENLNNVDYIKIDTEGFEKEVLMGLGDIKPRFIQFEFNINHLQRDVTLCSITDLLPGYVFYRLLPNGWIQINPEEYINNIFIFSNFVAVKNNFVKVKR